jgi:serine/threonine-protein phosphatase PGAM5
VAIRRVILVRHGQYSRSPERLTDLGRAQVEVTSARLAALTVHTVVSSTLPRARETCDILAKHHPKASRSAMRLLDERITLRPRSGDPEWAKSPSDAFWEESHDIIERAHARLFRVSRTDRTEVYGIHGNIIRTLTLRAMNFPTNAWAELWIHHASVTILDVYPDAVVRLVSFNDVGHLPPAMVTEQ